MKAQPKQPKRFVVMSVPGRYDDGRDTSWYVLDRESRRSVACHDFDTARLVARAANAAGRLD